MKIEEKTKVRDKRKIENEEGVTYSTYLGAGELRNIASDFGSIEIDGKEFHDAVSIGDEVTLTVEVKP